MSGKYILIKNYIDGELQGSAQYWLLPIRPDLVIGRSPEVTPASQQCYTVTGWGPQLKGVSRNHCTILLAEGNIGLIRDGAGDRGSHWGTYWGTKRLDQSPVEMLPENEEHVIIEIAPHRLTATVSSERILPDVGEQDDTVRTNIHIAQLEMRVEALEREQAELKRAIADLQSR